MLWGSNINQITRASNSYFYSREDKDLLAAYIQLGLENDRTKKSVKEKESGMVAEAGSYHKKTDITSR